MSMTKRSEGMRWNESEGVRQKSEWMGQNKS